MSCSCNRYSRLFPNEYYKCTSANSLQKKERWLCNKPLSPVQNSTIISPNVTNYTDLQNTMDSINPESKNLNKSPMSHSADEDITEASHNNCDCAESTVPPSENEDSVDNCNKYHSFTTITNLNNLGQTSSQSSVHYSDNESFDDSIADPDFNLSEEESNENITSTVSTRQAQKNKGRKYEINTDNISCRSSPILSIENCIQYNSSKYKKNGEPRKGKKGKDFCFYCENLVLNFSRHIRRNHSCESEVQKILSLPAASKERKECLSLLRKKGNFLNIGNTKKAVKLSSVCEKLLPCTKCLGFYSAKQLWRHKKYCDRDNSKNCQSNAQSFLLKNLRIDPKLQQNVFPRMRADNVSLVAKKDHLICAFGARYINQNREKHLINVASRKMRELAKLIIEMRNREPAVSNLFQALKPKYFDLIVTATKAVANYNEEKDYYKSPTYALNIRTSLKQCCEIAIIYVLKRKQVYSTIPAAEAEADLKTMIQLIESQWRFEVSTQAGNDLNIKKWNKVTLVPLASDLKILKEYLITKANSAVTLLLNDNLNKESYNILLETVFCRVILLNRKRPGELERLLLHIYEQAQENSQNYEEFSSVLNPSEQILMKKFKRIVIRGKRGRGVPVLFSPDVQEHIDILLKYRNNFVNKNNIYLFCNTNTKQSISGYKTLRKYAIACGAKNPNAITATRLRKHLATLTQLFSMSESDIEQLATFMGHTVGVHRGSYRLPDDVYQTAKITKLLLLMEKGAAAEFKGKALNEIEIDLNDDLLRDDNNYDDDNYEDENDSENSPLLDIGNEYDASNEDIKKSREHFVKKKKRVLIPWTEEQKKVVKLFFSDHIKKKVPPKKNECLELIEQNSSLLENKNWLKIKVFIQNEYQKKK